MGAEPPTGAGENAPSCPPWCRHDTISYPLFVHAIDHFRMVSIRPGWAHSQRRVGVNITVPSIDRHVNEL